MTGLPALLSRALAADISARRPIAVAFSGGRDSTVLLHALSVLREQQGFPLRALHVRHDLQPDAGNWAAHCARFCERLGLPFSCLPVHVPRDDGTGLEAAARRVRYAALAEALAADELLLTAHHRDDQVETLLMHLRRGSGATGLAGIAPRARLGTGELARPLLELARGELADWAERHRLSWVEDPSNQDVGPDRNFLRHEILPLIERRWPEFSSGVARSAAWQREARGLLEGLAAADAAQLLDGERRVDVDGLAVLEPARRRLLLRWLCRRERLPLPPATALASGLDALLRAGADRQPLLTWPGAELRRYRGRLYLIATQDPATAPPPGRLYPGAQVELGGRRGRLHLAEGLRGGLDPRLADSGLELRFRRGGERLRPVGSAHQRPLKLLFQEYGLVPWMRQEVPLLYAGERLVAVAHLWLAADACVTPERSGLVPVWTGHGQLR
ncbi:MAG: tRNA lysidine(34) synthetase TilS [Chromatiales bacterium]|nr:tRNA lysidine(34) synthetase TilS [Chromatiales bacterium]